MKLASLACLLSLIALSTPARASPYKIPDADAADGWEVKVSVETEFGAGEHVRAAPVLDITAPIRPGLETSVTFGWARGEAGGVVRNGFLDFEWAAKAEMLHQSSGAFASVTIEPAIIAPTGTNGFSAHAWAVELPVIISRQMGPLEARGLIAYARTFNDEPAELQLGLLASLTLSETLSVGAEIGREGDENTFGTEAENSVGVGFKWEFAPGYELQARVGRARHDGANEDEAALFLERAF